MKWLDIQVSKYSTHADNFGQPATFRDILLNDFVRDLDTIIALRKLDRNAPDYKKSKVTLKSGLQCYTPAALLKTKMKDHVEEIHRTGIMQLDFDYQDISEYDVEDLKQHVFTLPWVAFCGLSCSGDGFYALVAIAESNRLSEYAEHCFGWLADHGIKADTSKGKKVENLRYLSYDSNMLIRDNPEPLKIKTFRPKPTVKKASQNKFINNRYTGTDALTRVSLEKIKNATTGQRWQTVQQVAYTLGGTRDTTLLEAIKAEINNNSEFAGEETKYCKCAEDCFSAGSMKPLTRMT
jgi:hypothetical protein